MFSKGITGIVGGIVAGVASEQNGISIPSGPFNALAFHPASVWDLSDLASLSQDVAGGSKVGGFNMGDTPVTAPGDPVGFIGDQTSNNHNIFQIDYDPGRMILSSRFAQNMLQDDYVDDYYNWEYQDVTGTFVSVGPFGVEIYTLDATDVVPNGQWYYRQFYANKILNSAQIAYLRTGLTDLYSAVIGDYIAEMTSDTYNDTWSYTPDPAPGGTREIVFSDAQVADGPPWLTNDYGGESAYTNTITGLVPNETTFKIAGTTTPELVTQIVIDGWDTNTTISSYVDPTIYPVLETYFNNSRTQGPLPKNFNGWPSTLQHMGFNSTYSWGRASSFVNAPFANTLNFLNFNSGHWTGVLDVSPLKAITDLYLGDVLFDELIMNGCTSLVTLYMTGVDFTNIYLNNCPAFPAFGDLQFYQDASLTVTNCDTIDNVDFSANGSRMNLLVANCAALTSVETDIDDDVSIIHYENLPSASLLRPGGYNGDGNSGSGRCNKMYINQCNFQHAFIHVTGDHALTEITNCTGMFTAQILVTVANGKITIGDCENLQSIEIDALETTINLYNLPALTTIRLNGSGD